jgi:hypothetical protein
MVISKYLAQKQVVLGKYQVDVLVTTSKCRGSPQYHVARCFEMLPDAQPHYQAEYRRRDKASLAIVDNGQHPSPLVKKFHLASGEKAASSRLSCMEMLVPAF